MTENKIGQYMYCLIQSDVDLTFDAIGISGPENKVYTVCHDGLAAVVSDSPIIEYEVSRENLLAQQKVNEFVMKDYVILPFRFCTIAERVEDIRKKVLVPRRKQFLDKFGYMADKSEHGIRVIWKDMNGIFNELIEERNDLKRMRDRLATLPPDRGRDKKIELGEKVKRALEEKNAAVEDELFHVFKPLAVEAKKNKLYGDRMILNGAFLIQSDMQAEFDEKVSKMSEQYADRMQFKYVGPTQPSNFVEIVVHWD